MNTETFWFKRDLDHQKDWAFPEIEWDNWLVLYGQTGSGKTEYAKSQLVRWEGWEFTNMVQFFNVLKTVAQNERNVSDFMRTINEYPQMILDDIGFEPEEKFNHYGTDYVPTNIVKDILTERHERRLTTIITTNLNPAGLKEKYGDRIYSRLKELADWYLWKGDRRIGEKATVTKKERKRNEKHRD